jgi:hypothetical protein
MIVVSNQKLARRQRSILTETAFIVTRLACEILSPVAMEILSVIFLLRGD